MLQNHQLNSIIYLDRKDIGPCLENVSEISKQKFNKYQCLRFYKRKKNTHMSLFVSGTSKELHLLKTCLFWLMCKQLNITLFFYILRIQEVFGNSNSLRLEIGGEEKNQRIIIMTLSICRQRNQIKTVTKQTKILLLKMRGIFVRIENYDLVLKSKLFEKLLICFQFFSC